MQETSWITTLVRALLECKEGSNMILWKHYLIAIVHTLAHFIMCETHREKMCHMICLICENSSQPAHPCRLKVEVFITNDIPQDS